ncbi:MAG: glycosyltransferase [Lachnospiraceae bacterium]|nr:glycosyltransferase [Lachnospiraceae bacterium]
MIKEKIKAALVKREDAKYEDMLEDSLALYNNWYRIHKRKVSEKLNSTDHSGGEKLSSEVVRYSHLRSYLLSGAEFPDIIIACDDEGTITDYAEKMIKDYFAANRNISLVYGDEDRIDEKGRLVDPWLKSDWAPDTFLSTFYFGSIFAFRSDLFTMINPGGRTATDYEAKQSLSADREEEDKAARSDLDDAMASWIYGKLCLKMAQAEGGFSRRSNGRFPIGHIPEVLFHRQSKPVMWDSRLIRDSLTGRYSQESAASRLISIIIPSKDNPKMLLRCVKTIEQYTISSPYELIIVDNGSSPENRKEIEGIVRRHTEIAEGMASYLYEPMEFNFSRMCNMGAEQANGELLLFLNDDIEIRRPGWLSYLSEKAKLPYVGAVGMKLLYPGSDIIQHAGVVNLKAGPVHKLQYMDNTDEHYFGYNKGVRNVIAVTGACLMVRAEVFTDVGGFDEERFAVAFNDVDLCYRIYEAGYYNVVRNNMYLYHHESFSRGDDRKDEVKSARLSRELETLLRAHPDLYGKDPFYHPLLSQNPVESDFVIDMEEELIRDEAIVMVTPQRFRGRLQESWIDPVLRLGVEYANALRDWYLGPFAPFATEGNTGYYIRGYSFVINADNAVYERKLLLRSSLDPAVIYELPVEARRRDDIAANLTDQINDRLTGFFAVFPEGAVPAGDYTVGMLCRDRTSRQRLLNWSDVTLHVDE